MHCELYVKIDPLQQNYFIQYNIHEFFFVGEN